MTEKEVEKGITRFLSVIGYLILSIIISIALIPIWKGISLTMFPRLVTEGYLGMNLPFFETSAVIFILIFLKGVNKNNKQ